MAGKKLSIFVLLFCLFPARVLMHWVPLIGLPIIATMFVMAEYLSLIFLIVSMLTEKAQPPYSRSFKILYFLYIVYCLYLIYYIMINPIMPRDVMQQVNESNFSLLRSMLVTTVVLPVVVKNIRYLNIQLFIKASAVFMFLVLLGYTLTSNMASYLYIRTLPNNLKEDVSLEDYNLISALIMCQFCSMAFLFNFAAKDLWGGSLLKNIYFFLSSLFLIGLLLFFSERGPVLFMILTIIYYYFAKGKLGKTVVILSSLVAIAAFFFSEELLSLSTRYDYTLIERFLNIGEDGGSGRIGGEDSVYGQAFKQIMDGPLFGSYFRMYLGLNFYGGYPHNFVIELLMTFGVVFTIPFLVVFLKGVKNSYFAIKTNNAYVAFYLIFINIFACYLTSFTICGNNNLWILLAIALSQSFDSKHHNNYLTKVIRKENANNQIVDNCPRL